MSIRYLIILLILMSLTGCFAKDPVIEDPEQPTKWTQDSENQLELVDISYLDDWWEKFNDPVLNNLVTIALENSPDRLIAAARINQARGLQRTSRSFLYPQVDVLGNAGREDPILTNEESFYDARFDATYELDVFGENRDRVTASEFDVDASVYEYEDVSLTLIGDVARAYLRVREFQKQVTIAKRNLKIQEDTLKIVQAQYSFGEVPRLDVERSENLVNTTKASIPEFERFAINARLQLSTLLGLLPEELENQIGFDSTIPGGDVNAVLLSPTSVLAYRPDVQAAFSRLNSSAAITAAENASLFPSFSIGAFYGVADTSSIDSTTIWSILLSGAFSLLDFGRIEGRIDTAEANQVEAYENYRRTILNALTEVETAMNDYAKINNQRVSLFLAFKNADKASELSLQLFKEGEISFLDVLDAQRTANEADSDFVTAQAAQSESLIRLFKSLGVY
ncbi:MAG: TolC family protein [Pseudomonadota bacterium]